MQFAPVLLIPAARLLFGPRYTHSGYLLAALAIYAVAKVAEHYDAAVFAVTAEFISGHSLKHLLAALALWVVCLMLTRRQPGTARDGTIGFR